MTTHMDHLGSPQTEVQLNETLKLLNVCVSHGSMRVVHDVSLEVPAGACVLLLGSNGAGRSSLASAIMGFLPIQSGRIECSGQDISHHLPYQRNQMGLGYVPEHRDVFGQLTVEQNLLLGEHRRAGLISRGFTWLSSRMCSSPTWSDQPRPWSDFSLKTAYELFPALKQRAGLLARFLSGGEQQQLALARALMTQPRWLIADEPMEGLSPQMSRTLALVFQECVNRGMGLLLIEQRRLADQWLHYHQVFTMNQGRLHGVALNTSAKFNGPE